MAQPSPGEAGAVEVWLRHRIRYWLAELSQTELLNTEAANYLNMPDFRRQVETWLEQPEVSVALLDDVYRLLAEFVMWLDAYSTEVYDRRQAILSAMQEEAVTRLTPPHKLN